MRKKKTVRRIEKPVTNESKLTEKQTPEKKAIPNVDTNEIKNEPQVDPDTEPKVESTQTDQVPGTRKENPVKDKINAPQISANLDSLLKSIEKKENDKAGNGVPYTVEEIQKIFDEFREKADSQSLKTAMKYIKIRIEDNIITIITPTRIYVDFIKQEIHLLERIHDQYPNRDIKLLFEVNEKTFPDYEPPKKPKSLTTKEKYDLLVSKNPEFEKMVDVLKMKISNK